MAQFKYKAKAVGDERVIQDIIIASDYPEAYNAIIDSGYLPMQIVQVDKKVGRRGIKKLKLRQVAIFCTQFSAMISAGMPIVKSFDILRLQPQDSKNKNLTPTFNKIYNDIQQGMTLYESMLAMEDVFPPVLINMVRAGEASGNLDVVLEKSSKYFDDQHKLASKITSSMVYPVILLVLIVVVVLALFLFILPQFLVVFEQMDIELPFITKMLQSGSDFLREKWYVLIIFVFTVALIINILTSFEKVAYFLDEVKLMLPVVKTVVMKVSIARFMSTFSVLYSSGISILEAINISSGVVSNRVFKDKLFSLEMMVEGGTPMSEAMTELELFEPLAISMVEVGEESGNLDVILDNTADFYHNESEQAIAKLVSMLEPIMIIIIGIIVGIIVAGVMMPTFALSVGISETI